MKSGLLKLNIIIIVFSVMLYFGDFEACKCSRSWLFTYLLPDFFNNSPTINGQWGSEWTSGLQTTFGTNSNFTDEWYLAASNPKVLFTITSSLKLWIIRITQGFCSNMFNGGMTADSGPSSTDFAINFTSNAVCTWYQGNGVGWTQIATPSLSVFQWSESFSSSPTYGTPHLILEMSLLKTSTELGGSQIIGPEFWMLLQTYDAQFAGSGVQSWPTMPPSPAPTYQNIWRYNL